MINERARIVAEVGKIKREAPQKQSLIEYGRGRGGSYFERNI
jgi:chorismate mutase